MEFLEQAWLGTVLEELWVVAVVREQLPLSDSQLASRLRDSGPCWLEPDGWVRAGGGSGTRCSGAVGSAHCEMLGLGRVGWPELTQGCEHHFSASELGGLSS